MGGRASRSRLGVGTTRRPELRRATLLKGRAYWLGLSFRFRPASRRTAQASRLCYPETHFPNTLLTNGVGAARRARWQKKLASAHRFPQHGRGRFAGVDRSDMKAKIIITPKKAVVDPQGKAVQNALEHLGYNGIRAVHVGKYLEIELNGADPAIARRQIDEACHKFLSNPVIEDYRLELE